MSDRNVRFRFLADSELPVVIGQLDALQQILVNNANASKAHAAAVQQSAQAILGTLSQVQQAQQAQVQATQRTTTATQQTTAAVQQNTVAVQQGAAQQTAAAQQINDSVESMKSQFTSLTRIIGAAFTFHEIKQFGEQVIDAKSKIDFFQNGFAQMVQSQREAAALYPKIIELAKTTPFGVEDLFQTTLRLKAMGVATEELIPTLTTLGNAAAVVGTDKLPLVAKAYTDVMNKGKLMKQEINQFAENGIPLYDLLAKSMGKTREEIVKLAEDHELTFSDIKKALADASAEGGRYYNMMAVASQTLGGRMANLKDTFFVAKAAIGDYIEDGVRQGINVTLKWIDTLAGSQSAIDRTINYIKAGVTAYATYTVATNATAIATNAAAAAKAAWTVVLKAGEIAVGTYNIVMYALNQTMTTYAASQTTATATARTFWTTLAANPLAVVVAALGTLVASYYAYKAATEEVLPPMGEMIAKLKTEQQEFGILAGLALNNSKGTDARRQSILNLIQKYPEYFSGIDAEKVKNSELIQIINRVNQAFTARINLARESYNLERAEAKQKSLFEREADAWEKYKDKLPKDLVIKVETQGNPSQFFKEVETAMFTGGKAIEGFNKKYKISPFELYDAPGMAILGKQLTDGFGEVQKQMATHYTKVDSMKKAEANSAVQIENTRWEQVSKNLKKGSVEYQQAYNDHIKKLDGLSGKVVEQEIKIQEESKKKTVLTQKEITEIMKTEHVERTQTLKDYEAMLWAQAKNEIDIINHKKISHEAAESQIRAIVAKTEDTIKTLREAGKKEFIKNEQERLSAVDLAQKEIEAFNKRTQKGIVDAEQLWLDKRKKEYQKFLDSIRDDYYQISQARLKADEAEALARRVMEVKDGNERRKLLVDIGKSFQDELAGVALARLKKEREAAITHAVQMGELYGNESKEFKQATKDMLESDKDYQAARYKNAVETTKKQIDLQKQYEASQKEMINKVLDSLSTAFKSVDDVSGTAFSSMLRTAQTTFNTVSVLIKKMGQDSEHSAEYAMQAAAALFEGLATMIGQHLIAREQAHQKALDNEFKAFKQAKEDELKAFKEKTETEIDLLKEKEDVELDSLEKTKDKNLEALDEQYDAFKDKTAAQLEALKDAKTQEIELAQSTYDKKIELLNAERDAAKAAIKEQTEALLQANETRTQDEITKTQVLDRVRLEALDRWKANQIAMLQAERERVLAGIENDSERQQMAAYYDQKMREIHDQFEEAKLDKSKATQLAQIQLKTEEKAETERLKAEEAQRLKEVEERYAQESKLLKDWLTNEKLAAENRYDVAEKALREEQKAAQRRHEQEVRDIKKIYTEEREALERRYADTINGLKDQIASKDKSTQEEIFNKQREIERAKLDSQRKAAKIQLWISYAVAVAQMIAINPILGLAAGAILLPLFIVLSNKIDDAFNGNELNVNGSSVDASLRVDKPDDPGSKDGGGPKNGDGAPVPEDKGPGVDTGERPAPGFKDGTSYLDLNGNPRGTDTIPALYGGRMRVRLDEGERILDAKSNRLIGGRSLTNPELVDRLLKYDEISSLYAASQANFRELASFIPGIAALELPVNIAKDAELLDEMKKTRKAVESGLFNVNVDRYGIRIEHFSEQRKNVYYDFYQ